MCQVVQLCKKNKIKQDKRHIRDSKAVNQNVDSGQLTVQICKEFKWDFFYIFFSIFQNFLQFEYYTPLPFCLWNTLNILKSTKKMKTNSLVAIIQLEQQDIWPLLYFCNQENSHGCLEGNGQSRQNSCGHSPSHRLPLGRSLLLPSPHPRASVSHLKIQSRS